MSLRSSVGTKVREGMWLLYEITEQVRGRAGHLLASLVFPLSLSCVM